MNDAIRFLKSTRMTQRDKLITDVKANAARRNADMIVSSVLINLFVNYEAVRAKQVSPWHGSW
jgi:hypothetical protein